MRRLVEALNACWLPHFPGRASITLADFKRDIRERQVWCSSCMIAFDGAEPIGVLIGAKRPDSTLIDAIAVRPDRMRQGHGRHMMTSLASKLEILGPPRLFTEIPESLLAAAPFFETCGFAREATLTDWVLGDGGRLATPSDPVAGAPGAGGDAAGSFVVPTTVADLVANRLLTDAPGIAWDRGAATLQGRADHLAGFGLATVERIAAFVLYRRDGNGRPGATIDALGPAAGAEREGCRRLLVAVLEAAGAPLMLPRLAADELPSEWLEAWGFLSVAVAHRYTASASPS